MVAITRSSRVISPFLPHCRRRHFWSPGTGYRPRGDNPQRRPVLQLRANAEAKVKQGHPLVPAAELRGQAGESSPAGLVNLQASNGEVVAVAIASRFGSSIGARILSAAPNVPVNVAFFTKLLRQCLQYRDVFFVEPFYRLVNCEADQLPGIIIDRYGDHIVIQAMVPGMDCLLWPLVDALEEVIKPKVVLIRHDGQYRKDRSNGIGREVVLGQYCGPTELRENSVTYLADLLTGPGTGWFYDRRQHRQLLASLATNTPKVLDLFSYSGGFGISCAVFGAEEVVCVDSSESALELARQSATANLVEGRVRTIRSDVMSFLQAQTAGAGDEGPFDLIIVDPPSQPRERKPNLLRVVRFYEQLISAAAGLCGSPSFLFVASSTPHLGDTDLLGAASRALGWAGRQHRVVSHSGQALDHPRHPLLSDAHSLKSFLFHLS